MNVCQFWHDLYTKITYSLSIAKGTQLLDVLASSSPYRWIAVTASLQRAQRYEPAAAQRVRRQ